MTSEREACNGAKSTSSAAGRSGRSSRYPFDDPEAAELYHCGCLGTPQRCSVHTPGCHVVVCWRPLKPMPSSRECPRADVEMAEVRQRQRGVLRCWRSASIMTFKSDYFHSTCHPRGFPGWGKSLSRLSIRFF